MKTRKSLLLSAGVVAISALLATTNSVATPPTQCTTTNYIVDVQKQTANSVTSYTYTMSSPTGKNLNKFFIYVKGRQVDGQGLEGDLVGMVDNSVKGSYVPNGQFSSSLPPSDGWKYIKQLDGWVFPYVAINNVLKLTVSERFQVEEGTTTILLLRTVSKEGKDDDKKGTGDDKKGTGDDYTSNTVEPCGPILGPTTPLEGFPGSPLVSTVSRKTFENGCVYDVVAGSRDNIVVSMTPVTPFGTNPPEECTVDNIPDVCQTDLGLAFCPPGELGRPPLQSVSGGICYYAPNLKFRC